MSDLFTPEGTFVRIKIRLCQALHINTAAMKMLIDRYVNQNYDRDSVRIHFTKVNIYNELSSDKMTIKVFINKFLRVIEAKTVKIALTVTTAKGRVVVVEDTLNLGGHTSIQKDEEELGEGLKVEEPRMGDLFTPEGTLVRIKIRLCQALHINTAAMKMLIDKYVNQNYDRTSVRTHFTKVNIYNELSSDKMTIKVFINKFLRIIEAKTVKITVTVTTAKGKVVVVEDTLNLGGHTSTQKDEQDDKQPKDQ